MTSEVQAGLADGREPRRGKPKRSQHQRRQAAGREQSLSQQVQVRFVYEGELKGEWFRVADALHIPVYPHPGHTVIRLEFRDNLVTA